VLLYFGDVLTIYAVCGFLLLRHVGQRPAQLSRAVRRWWIAFVLLTLLGGLFAGAAGRYAMSGPDAGEIDPQSIAEGSLQAFEVFTTGSYVEQLSLRAAEYVELQFGIFVFAVPQIMALFSLGLLAGRLGWLRHPARHAFVWRWALRVGLAALPLALLGAWLSTTSLLATPGTPSILGSTLITLSTPLAAAYVALIMRRRSRGGVARAIDWLAPAGRMPLSNYILQSAFMGALLSGWGAGLGARWNHAALALVALVIVVAQWLLSRWWIGRFGQGPLEAVWRRATYGRRGTRGTLPAAPLG
jgi:uncharacterized protein